MTTHPLLFAIAVLVTGGAAGCASGQGEVDVTTTHVVTFPAAPAGLTAPQTTEDVVTEGTVTVDLQKDLASLGGAGPLQGSVSENDVSGEDLGLLRHIELTISPDGSQGAEQVLSDADVPSSSTRLDLPLLVSDAQLLAGLERGQVAVHFYVTGPVPQHPLTLTHTMTARVSVPMNGPVTDL